MQTTTGPRLQAGDLAPDAVLIRTSGDSTTLADLFRHKRTLLVFLRHFG